MKTIGSHGQCWQVIHEILRYLVEHPDAKDTNPGVLAYQGCAESRHSERAMFHLLSELQDLLLAFHIGKENMITDLQKRSAQAIVNIFETGRPQGDYGGHWYGVDERGPIVWATGTNILAFNEGGDTAVEKEKTFESTVLDRNPGVREAVLASKDFQAWKDTLPTVVVDGIKFYIRGGDMLKDEDQVICEWAYRSGLLPEDSPD